MSRSVAAALLTLSIVTLLGCASSAPPAAAPADRYAKYVWPPPPDQPRIRLLDIVEGRIDVEAQSSFARTLIGASPQGAYDKLKKPFAVKYDRKGRLLVTDSALGALFRFDRETRRMDVFGTTGALHLKLPLGLAVAPDGRIFVADAGQQRVIVFDADGNITGAFGHSGELVNPAGVAIAPDQKRLFVADSKAHQIVVYDLAGGAVIKRFGKRGEGEGEFSFPTSLAFSREGELCVIDQINARVQLFSAEGEFLDTFGSAGKGFGNFVRPKDIALDDDGLIYVTDGAFSNVQIFSKDLTLLTFIGSGGREPGQFQIASGVATHGNQFAVVDQIGRRVQVFRFIGPKLGEPERTKSEITTTSQKSN